MYQIERLVLKLTGPAEARAAFLQAADTFAEGMERKHDVGVGFEPDDWDDPRTVTYTGVTDGDDLEKFLLPYVVAGLFEPVTAFASNDEGVETYYLTIFGNRLVIQAPMPGPAIEEWKVEEGLCYFNDDERTLDEILEAGVPTEIAENLLNLEASAIEVRGGQVLFEIRKLTIEKVLGVGRLWPAAEWVGDCFTIPLEGAGYS